MKSQKHYLAMLRNDILFISIRLKIHFDFFIFHIAGVKIYRRGILPFVEFLKEKECPAARIGIERMR